MKPVTVNIICAMLLFLFLYTAIEKLTGLQSFRDTLNRVAFTRGFAPLLATGIPAWELATAGFLFFPRYRLAGLYSSAALLLTFTLYIACMLLFVPDRPCSCGGVIAYLSWPQHLVFNVFFLLLSVVAILLSNNNFNKKWKPPGNPDTGPTLP